MSFFPPSPPSPLPNPAAAEFSTPGPRGKAQSILGGSLGKSPLPASAARSSRHHASYAKPKRERIPNACPRAIGRKKKTNQKRSDRGPSERIQSKRVKCANSCTSVGGCGYVRSSRRVHPAKRSCSCCVSSSVGGSGADEWIWISSSCYLCCCSRPHCWPRNTTGRASSPRSSHWPSRRISGDS